MWGESERTQDIIFKSLRRHKQAYIKIILIEIG